MMRKPSPFVPNSLITFLPTLHSRLCFFFFQAEDGIRDFHVTGVQTCALPILAGQPIDLVPCLTVDADVPADAEIVIEGHFVPKAREPEGPFGEVAGTYGLLGNRHVFEVSAITMRRDAMYQTALTGMPTTDNHVQGWPAICESIKRMAQLACPEVVDVHAIGPYYVAIVAIKKRLAHEARNVILSVLGPTAGAPQAKYCIVVDPDVNVRDINQVLWALYTRVQPDQDAIT